MLECNLHLTFNIITPPDLSRENIKNFRKCIFKLKLDWLRTVLSLKEGVFCSNSYGYIKPDWKWTIYRQKLDILLTHFFDIIIFYLAIRQRS